MNEFDHAPASIHELLSHILQALGIHRGYAPPLWRAIKFALVFLAVYALFRWWRRRRRPRAHHLNLDGLPEHLSDRR